MNSVLQAAGGERPDFSFFVAIPVYLFFVVVDFSERNNVTVNYFEIIAGQMSIIYTKRNQKSKLVLTMKDAVVKYQYLLQKTHNNDVLK